MQCSPHNSLLIPSCALHCSPSSRLWTGIGLMWTWLFFFIFVVTQGTNSFCYKWISPPLFSGDNLFSISRNLLAELSLTAGEREILLRSHYYLGQLGFHLKDCWVYFSLYLNPVFLVFFSDYIWFSATLEIYICIHICCEFWFLLLVESNMFLTLLVLFPLEA